MKLSSVSLVVTTLAAMAGSAIAAPGPLHARALDTINSFGGRDVDVNGRESVLALLEREVEFVDELSTRDDCPDHEGSGKAAKAHESAAETWTVVATKAYARNDLKSHSHALSQTYFHASKKTQHQIDKEALLKGKASEEQKIRASNWKISLKDAWNSEYSARQHLGFH